MKPTKTWFALLSLSLTMSAISHAEIREAVSMRRVDPSITSDTLVIFDIDNTVLEAAQSLGSDQWFSHEVKRGIEAGKPEKEATLAVVKRWLEVQKVTRVRPVERGTPRWISGLQDDGLTVMALTARPMAARSVTNRQLDSLDVDFTRNPPSDSDVSVGEQGSYSRGILFVGPTGDKGETLLAFFRKIGRYPRRVVFVDDKLKNVQSVDLALTHAGLPNIDFRYGAADERVRAYDPRIGDAEWNEFQRSGRILPDSEFDNDRR